MITKRIIPCLDVKDGRVVKGVNFAGLQKHHALIAVTLGSGGNNGRVWLEHGVKNGAGELVVNSIDTDGVKNGFDLELLDAVAQRCAVPIIADFHGELLI